MTVGIQVFNDSGIFQIDGEFKNLCLRSKVSVTCNVAISTGSGTSYASAIQNYSGITNLVIALRATTASVQVWWVSSTQYRLLSNTNGTAVTVYLFGDPVAPATTSGFQVYNTAGGLVFESDAKYMRVAGFEIMPDTTHSDTFTYAAGKTYATVTSGGFWGRTVATGAPSGSNNYWLHEWQLPGSYWSSNVLNMSGVTPYFTYTDQTNGSPYEVRSSTFILVLDVTGY